jgi:hypothetical protein
MMTSNKPLTPPLRKGPGSEAHRVPPSEARPIPAEDPGCTIPESCDQCGRRLRSPHMSSTARAYCRDCCPSCALQASVAAGAGRRRRR